MNKEKLIGTIIGIVLFILLIIGGSLAYWFWQTSTNEQTKINISVSGGELNIVGDNVSETSMYPTTSCDGSAALIGFATVTAINELSTEMTAYIKIRASFYGETKTPTSSDLEYLKWAIVDTTSDTTSSCSNPDYSGTFSSVTPATSKSDFPSVTYTDIDTGISFKVSANSMVEKTYTIYVWLNSSYTYTNVGSTNTDPMQNLNINVSWSKGSTLSQS